MSRVHTVPWVPTLCGVLNRELSGESYRLLIALGRHLIHSEISSLEQMSAALGVDMLAIEGALGVMQELGFIERVYQSPGGTA